MASGTFPNIVNSFGLKSNGTNAIDVVNGIPVRINNYKGNATVYVYAGGKDRAQSVIGPMVEAAASYGMVKPRVAGEAITFGFKSYKTAVDHYEKIRQIISQNASQLAIDQCPYCNMGTCDVAGMYNSATARRMHRQCYLNQRNVKMDSIRNSDGNYITGIIGAILAAALMVTIANLMVLGAETILYILYLAFPLAIAGGFRLLKGPYGPMATFCHLVISFLAMFAYFYVQGCWLASKWYHVTMIEAVPYFSDVMEIITDSEFVQESAREIVLFIVGIIVVLVANPTSKRLGTKSVQQDDVFITPVTAVGAFGYGDSAQGYNDPAQGYNTSDQGIGTDSQGYGNTDQTADSGNTYDTSQNYRG